MIRHSVSVVIFVSIVASAADIAFAQAPPAPLPPFVGVDTRFPAVIGKGVCSTQNGWCPLAYPEQSPPGSPCYCTLGPNQADYGTASSRDYRGNVNPFFNPHSSGVPSTIK